jgi:starch-binding outer membrane protein, SusD/RagB family
MKKIIYSIAILLAAVTLSGCSDFFNPVSNDVLLEKNYVGQFGELYSGYMGITASVQAVADKASFLEGLRGDLLEPTQNAPRDMWDVYNYSDVSTNSLADPKGYYNVILNSNDYLIHIFKYYQKDSTTLSKTTLNGLVGGALRYKAWAYLMLAKIYGEAIYLDDPLTSYQDITKYPVLKFDDVIEKCRQLIEVGVNGVNGKGDIQWSAALFPNQGASTTSLSWDRICPPSECLLAEIYLYQNDYQKVKDNCINLIKRGGIEQSYQLNLSEYNGEWKSFGYSFVRKEQIAVAYYDYSLHQTNHYIEYYSNNYPNKYYLRPTQANRTRFESQYNAAGVPNDQYRGVGVTYKTVNGAWVLQKFLAGNETSDKIYTNDVQICLYRAAEVHLFLVEALIGLGQFEQALAFLNDGVGSYYNSTTAQFLPPFQGYPSCLYRTSSTSEGANRGVRGRVALGKVGEFAFKSVSAMDTLVNMRRLDSLVVEETSLELAGEGKAYYAMNRMARRWSVGTNNTWASHWTAKAGSANPANLWGSDVQNVWAAKVGAKYTNGSGTKVASSLSSDLNNWFIKYKLN